MNKSVKESNRANTKARKQACNRQHPNIKEAPDNNIFSKIAKKTRMQESILKFTPRKNIYAYLLWIETLTRYFAVYYLSGNVLTVAVNTYTVCALKNGYRYGAVRYRTVPYRFGRSVQYRTVRNGGWKKSRRNGKMKSMKTMDSRPSCI